MKFVHGKSSALLLKSVANFNASLFVPKGVLVTYTDVVGSDEFVDVVPGIRKKHVDKTEYIATGTLRRAFPDIDFEEETLFLMTAKAGTETPLHYHICDETFYVLEGSFINLTTGEMINEGHGPYVIPSFTAHSTRYLKDTTALIVIPKIFIQRL